MLIRGLFALLCCLLASPAWSATIVLDAVTSATGVATTTHNHTIAADANFIAIGLGLRDGGDAMGAPENSVTVGGQAATFLCAEGGTFMRTVWYYKTAPLTGVQSIVTNAQGGSTVDDW
jgi:hypothetical protein